jgi:hypothetical protein
MNYLADLGYIAYSVVGPVLVLIAVGYLLGRRVPQTAEVLSKVFLYALIPTYVFFRILNADLGARAYGTIVLFSSVMVAALYAVGHFASRLRRHDRALRSAFVNSTILYNSANFSIPVMALAFAASAESQNYAVAVQAIVAVCQGVAAYTVGAVIAAAGSGPVGRAMLKALRLPFAYAVVAALILKRVGLGAEALERATLLWTPLVILSGAYVPVALMTLGAQMAQVKVVRAPADLALAVVARLVVGPLLGWGLVAAMGLEGPLAAILVIGSAAPSAVASAVVAIEFRNRPDFASSVVFLTTLGAAVTIPIVIFLARTFL